jgi:predicted dienelactone hydrolase
MFGFSAGGFTTLAIIGGVPDFTKIGPMCWQHPDGFACRLVAKSEGSVAAPAGNAVADARSKAAVVAARALGFAFSPDGLKNVKVPAQRWRAENDVIVPHPRYEKLTYPSASGWTERVEANLSIPLVATLDGSSYTCRLHGAASTPFSP